MRFESLISCNYRIYFNDYYSTKEVIFASTGAELLRIFMYRKISCIICTHV